jgi:hypothetical protein
VAEADDGWTGEYTIVVLDLPPSGSVFVVFRHGEPLRAVQDIESAGKPLLSANHLPAHPPVGPEIVKAVYGAAVDPQRQADVTAQVRAMIAAGQMTIGASNAFGDPALGTVKTLIITLRDAAGTRELRATEGSSITLPPPPYEPLPVDLLDDGRLLAWADGVYRVGDKDVIARGASAHDLAGPWTLAFPPGWDTPDRVTLPKLQPWSALQPAAVAHFSGTATYACSLDVPSLPADHRFALDLGGVADMAEVTVNGRRAGFLWTPPFRLDVTGLLKPGRNELSVAVTNTWRNRLSFDAGLPIAQRKTWTLAGPPPNAALEPAGLIGPVVLHEGVVVKP